MLNRVGHLVDRNLHALHDPVQIDELELHGANPRLLGLRHGCKRGTYLCLCSCSRPFRHDPLHGQFAQSCASGTEFTPQNVGRWPSLASLAAQPDKSGVEKGLEPVILHKNKASSAGSRSR